MKCLSAVIFSSLLSITVALDKLEVLYEWKYVDLDWSSADDKNSYIENQYYIPENIILYDVEVTSDKRFFVTAVRDAGVPASLMEVTDKMGDGGPLLRPYPSFEWYDQNYDCESIISVYRVATDPCNRLWVLDTGKVGDTTYCQPKLLVFDLSTNELVKRIRIPASVAVSADGNGLLVTPIVQTDDSECRRQTVYMADCEGYAIVVYNPATSKIIWRVDDYTFHPNPQTESITIAGDSFSIEDGVLGMALSSPISPGTQRINRLLFYSQLASFDVRYAFTEQLQNPNRQDVRLGKANKQKLPSQTSTMAIYTKGNVDILLFSQVQNTSIVCRALDEPFALSYLSVVEQDETALQFPSGMKVRNTEGVDMFVTLTNRYQKVATGSFSIEETNFRIIGGPAEDLVKGSTCVKHN